jgi:hypothetical protein
MNALNMIIAFLVRMEGLMPRRIVNGCVVVATRAKALVRSARLTTVST